MNYYKVTAIRGHIGAGNGAEIVFAIEANDACSAMKIAKRMPAVKHKSASIRHVELISKEEFDALRKESAYYRKR